jgi:hypothetical protein
LIDWDKRRGQQTLHQRPHCHDALAKGQGPNAPKKQTFFHIAPHRSGQLGVNTKLSPIRQTVTQPALRQTIEGQGAAGFFVGRGL